MSQKTEFEKFDKVMDGLLAVPCVELQMKLEEEKREKAKHKKKRSTSTVSLASSSGKKRVDSSSMLLPKLGSAPLMCCWPKNTSLRMSLELIKNALRSPTGALTKVSFHT